LLPRDRVYQRLKGSGLYDLYWRVADTQVVEKRDREVAFYRDLLTGFKRGDLIFDIGANQGTKVDIFLRLGAHVLAVEPDRANQRILKGRFLSYRVFRKPVEIVGKAISDKEGVETMFIDAPGSAKNTLSRKWVETLRSGSERFGHRLEFEQHCDVKTTTVERLVATFGRPFFVKIDVEGFEPSVIKGLRSPVPYLSFEVNLPEFRREGLECVDLLSRLDRAGTFNYTADCRHGLALPAWLGPEQFTWVLEHCSEASVEVFWKSSDCQPRGAETVQ
jgi:FkbM family methyltransferase